jgi:hypothetical protein
MKIKFLSLLFLSLVLISCVSATVVVKGYFSNNVNDNSETITEGGSITLKAIFSSTDTITQKSIQVPTGLTSDAGTCTLTGHTYTCTYSITGNSAGSYSIRIIGKDSSGSVDNDDVTLNVNAKVIADTTAPVITINGINPVTISVGNAYTDAGATASDNVDGVITSRIIISNNVNTNVVGSYSVIYSVTDNAGNTATATRIVNVISSTLDTTAPVINLNGANPQTIIIGNSYTELGATASDNVDGVITSRIIIDSSNVNVNLVGSYVVSYSVSDNAGNHVTTTRIVNVISSGDTTAPVITVISPSDNVIINSRTLYVELTTDEDAIVTLSLDDGSSRTMSDSADRFTYILNGLNNGNHILTFTAIDSSGNVATETVTFTVNKKSSGESSDIGSITIDSTSTNKVTKVIGEGSVIATVTKNTKQSYMILFYLLVGVVSLGTLITIYALSRKIKKIN